MVHTNKVLTVSYGTFSCTLEGFDDSFGTMKAIAEYFRDLASDDRYFGAEPPQPDAEMLARIAQREITRQVEGHSTDTGAIHLRATAPVTAEAATAADTVADMVADTEAVSEPVSVPVEDVAAEAPEDAVAPVPEVVSEPVSEIEPQDEPELVADLIAQTVAVETSEAIVEPEIEVSTDVEVEAEVEVEAAPEVEADAPPVMDEPEAAIPEAAITESIADPEDAAEDDAHEDIDFPAEVASALVDAIDDAEVEVDEPAEDTDIVEAEFEAPSDDDLGDEVVAVQHTAPAADSIAAKLQRIRAVVSQNDALEQSEDEYTEDQHAESYIEDAAEEISTTLNSDDGFDDDLADATAEVDSSELELHEILDQVDAVESDTSEDMTEDTANDLVAEDTIEAAEAMQAAAETTEDSDDEFFTKQDTSDGTSDYDEDDGFTGDDTDLETSSPLLARVVKVKRADVEAAIADGELEQIEEDQDFFDDQSDQSALSPEDEADLMRELTAVEDEVFEESAGQDDSVEGAEGEENIFGENITLDADQPENEDDFDVEGQSGLQQSVSEDEADLTRLMSEADEKLDDPDTSLRHETYSQLRGAMAVAAAEREGGTPIDDATEDEAYREDLADVVRPRRPAIDGARASRPVIEHRPAPLKLVAEQRVDDDGAGLSHRGPVRPRRVMSTEETSGTAFADVTDSDSAFAEFAERMGASELPELLEAAAAYLSFVEGHDKFSRPQLMNKVRLIKQDGYNREDGLRSFGQLLRDGKIKKKGGGRFSASGDIGYRPDDAAREAG